jgi:hypothetical protein
LDTHRWRQNGEIRRPTKYAVTDTLDVIGAYYHYDQNNFGAGPPYNSVAKATCSGTFDDEQEGVRTANLNEIGHR